MNVGNGTVAETDSGGMDAPVDNAGGAAGAGAESWYRRLVAELPHAVAAFDAAGGIRFANRAAALLFGYDDVAALQRCGGLERLAAAEERDRLAAETARLLSGARDEFFLEWRGLRRNGSSFGVAMRARRITSAAGPGMLATLDDAPGRTPAEHEVGAGVPLVDAVEGITDGVIICDRDNRIVLCNRAFRELHEPIADKLRPGLSYEDFLRLIVQYEVVVGAAEGGEAWVRERSELFSLGAGVREYQLLDGRWIQVVDRRTTSGFTVGLRTDITVPKLREEQLRQAQKMEAIGQLTGGIAHDFNNLLAIIQGNLSYLERQLGADSPYLELTAPALRATRRGAALTHRLLAFSRRQPLEQQVIDAGELLLSMQDLLRRTLGEQVSLDILPQAGLWRCVADPGQLEHAILNLAINARDAMPDGGRLLIELGNAELTDRYAAAQAEVAPGSYVAIAVSDTGLGMEAEVITRIFEPFFTTKETGKGTGLGLSMVFGFVKQSNGHITVYSEPGLGSTFKLYLPRSNSTREPPTSRRKRDAAVGGRQRGATGDASGL